MKRSIALALCLYLATTVPSAAMQQKAPPLGDLQVSSDSLGGMVLGNDIKLMTHDGTYVEGKVVRASPEEIYMRVKKSEPRDRVRGPEAAIRTADISVVYMKKGGTIAAPIALGIVGGFLGAVASARVAWDWRSAGAAITLVVAGTAGAATGGALLGREMVKKTLTINVVNR